MAKKKKQRFSETVRQASDRSRATTTTTGSEFDAAVNNVRNGTMPEPAQRGARIISSVLDSGRAERLQGYQDGTINPYASRQAAYLYGRDLEALSAAAEAARPKNFMQQVQTGQIWGVSDSYGTANRLKSALTQHQNIMSGVTDDDSFRQNVTYPMKYAGRDLNGILQAMAHLNQTGQGDSEEYKWLKEHQYDYWTEEDFKKQIAYLEGELDSATRNQYRSDNWQSSSTGIQRKNNGSGYMYDLPTAADRQDAEARQTVKNLKMQLSDLESRHTRLAYSNALANMDNETYMLLMNYAGASEAEKARARRFGYENSEGSGGQAFKRLMADGYSRDEALALLDYAEKQGNARNRQRTAQAFDDLANSGFLGQAASTLLGVPMRLAGGVLGFADAASQYASRGTDPFTGRKSTIDWNTAAMEFYHAGQDASSAVAEQIDSPVGKFAYNLLNSMLDSAAVAPIPGGEVLLGFSAAMQSAEAAKARGASDGQALLVGFFSGAAEAACEHLPLERIRGLATSTNSARRTFKNVLLDMGKQAGMEGTEELVTDILNRVSDDAIMGAMSEYNARVRELMAQGMSREDAERKATAEWVASVGEDFLAGALSGGIMGGGAMVANQTGTNVRNTRTGARINANDYGAELREYAAATPEGSEAQRLLGKLDNASGRRANRLTGALYNAVQTEGFRQAIQTRLQELGATSNESATAEAIQLQAAGAELTQQQKALTRTRAAQRVLTEFQSAIEGYTGMTNEWAYDAMRGAYEMDQKALKRTDTKTESRKPNVTEFAERYGEQAVAVDEVRKLQPELDSETFERQFETAYELGRGGAQMDVAMNTTATADLTETQRQTAWEMGRAAAEATIDVMEGENENGGEIRVRERSERNDGARAAEPVRGLEEGAEPAKGYPAAVARSAKDEGADSVKFRPEAVSTRQLGVREGTSRKGLYIPEESSYTPAMKEAVRVAEENGRKVVLFGGGNLEVRENGYIVSARGMYDEATNTVYVRADHPEYTADQIARHENGHGMIADGSIDVKEVQKQIAASMTEAELRKAIDDYVDLYDGTGLTEEQIIHEMICDALGNMNVFEEIDVFKEQAQRAERTMPAIRSAVQEQQKGRAPPEKARAESDSVRFSMETPVEKTKTLIAWHNMSTDALNGALEIGGLAMPSWAIQPSDKAHTQYGDVSVIAPRELIDPKRNRNSMIFGGDAWTPVFPEVNYKVSYEAAEALEDEIKALVGEDVFRQIGGAALDKDNIADQFKRSNGRLSGHYANNLLLKYAYLKSTGSDVEVPQREENLYYGGDFTNEDVQRFAGRLTDGKRTLEKLENMSVDELFEQDDLLQAIADIRRESYREKLKGRQDLLEKFEKSNLFSKNDIKYSTIDRMLKAARKYLDGGVQQTVDKKALQEIVDREVDQNAYEEWILQKLRDTVERKGIRNNKDLFTSSGNRRSFDQLNYAYTLANIVKAMKAQPKQGRAQFLSGPGSVRGAAMKAYKDVEQARAEIGRVIDNEDDSGAVDAAFDSYNENLSDILDRMAKNGDKFDAANALIEILQHAKTESGIYNYMQRELKDWYNVSPELAHDIYQLIGQVNELPIPYFEGKTYDAVRFDDVLAVVVPDTISEDLKNRLEDTGARVLEYKKNDEADRLRVVNSVKGAKFSRDIESLTELRQENRALRERLEEAQRQVKRSKGNERVRGTDVRRVAREVIKTAQSTLSVADIENDMQELGDYLIRGERDERKLTWTMAKARALEIAENLIDNASAMRESSDTDLYRELRQYLKDKKLSLSESNWSDIPEGYREFVRRNFGTMRIGKDGLPIESAWPDLQDTFGKGLFPDSIDNPADQIMHVSEVVNGLRPVYENPHSSIRDEMIEWTANDILDRLLDENVRQDKTYADKAEERRAKDVQSAREREREKRREAVQNAVKRERERRDKAVERLKRQFRESKIKDRERRAEREAQRKYRERIEKKAKTLGDWLLKNSDKEHVPEPLKKVVGDFLSTLDFTSKRALKGGEATKNDARYVKRLEALQEVIANQKAFQDGADNAQEMFGGYLDLPNGYMELLNEHLKTARNLAESGEASVINAMSAEQLRQLDEIITALTSSIRQINSLVSNGRFHSAISAAQDTIEKLRSMAEYQLGKDKLKRFLQWDNTNPFYAFRRFGEGGKAVFEGLQNGWDQFAFNVSDVLDYARDTYSDKEVREWSEKVHDFTLEDGHKVRMTTAQIMSLYKLLDRSQAVQHIEGGGIRIDNIEAGKNKIQQTDHYHFTAKDLADIVGTLTKRQREVADKLQQFMQERGGKWGNEVSMKRFGYEAFGEEHYFPIATDDSGRPEQNPGQQGNDLYRLLNMSMTKSLNPKANNALVVQDIFDVFADHMSDMAKYNALALPVLDTLKWYNYTERTTKDENGSFSETSLRREIVRAYGSGARTYINTFLTDLNGVTESSGRGEGIQRILISNYKVAAVAANARVALLQPTAYVRASYVLSAKHMIRALAMKPAVKECEKYSGISRWKSLGFYDTNISRGIREQIHDGGGVKEKIQEKAMLGAEWGDKLTWGVLWNACKVEQKAKGLTGEKLMEATALRFREVVYSSQVVDSTMTRSHTMRSKSLYAGMATAFMSEPTLSYNMLLDAYMGYSADARATNRSAAWKKHSGKFFKAVTVYCISATASAIVESLADAWRDDDDYEKFYQKFLEALFGGELTVASILGGNLVNNLNPLAKIPLFKDAISYLQGFENERIDTAGISDLVQSVRILYEYIAVNLGWKEDYTGLTYNGRMGWYGVLYRSLKGLSRMSGLPVSNLTREVAGLWNNTVGTFDPNMKVKTYNAGLKGNVKKAVEKGWLTEDEAVSELAKGGTDKNEAYFMVRGWITGGKKYEALLEAARSGDSKAFGREMDLLTSHGIEEKTAQSQVKSAVKQWYQGLDEDGEPTDAAKISKQAAINALVKYAGMSKEDAEAQVQKWTAFNVTGVQYDQLDDEFIDGNISESEYKKALMNYGGMSEEDAVKTVGKKKVLKDYGFEYSEDNVVDAAKAGDITTKEAYEIWTEYGGVSESEAQSRKDRLDFVVEHPDVAYEDAKVGTVEGYEKYVEAAKSANIRPLPAEDYVEYYTAANEFTSDYDENQKPIKGSEKKDKVFAYIAGLNISAEQKTALALSMYAPQTVSKMRTW